jgi:hypothetical protein
MSRATTSLAAAPVMRRLLIATGGIVAAAIGYVSFAQAQNCQELWVERNSYYKQYGYCFKTSRAIAYFGNSGCQYDSEASVPLPRGIRRRIAEITRLERELGCRD